MWDAPEGRHDDFVDPYFKHTKKDEVAVMLKAREPARIMIAIGAEERWHLQLEQRWIVQYNFYINDRRWGRMFVRISPYLPFSARVCLNQHHWLANQAKDCWMPNRAIGQPNKITMIFGRKVTGDGVNDAPAMMAATVGMAIGQNSDVTAEAAGVVVMESSLKKVDEFMHISRRMRTIALQSAVGGMLVSIAGMLLAASGHLSPVSGAISQEVIDLLAVLNALRAAFPPRVIQNL